MADQITPLAPIDDEIDLLALAKTLWNGRRTVIKSILICGVIGLLVALTSPKEYVATTIMVPSGISGGSSMGGLGGLAAMAGINFSAPSGGDLSPAVYPKIVSSLPYQLELIKTPLKFNELKEPVTFFDYYTGIQKPNMLLKYTIGLPRLIMGIPGAILSTIRGKVTEREGAIVNNDPIELNEKQQAAIATLADMISLNTNTKEGVLTLSSTMSEPLAAAQLGQRALELLQQYIIEFKIKKAKANLDFIQQRFDETAKKFETAQDKLASFRDRNKNVSLAMAKTEEERLTSQYNLIYAVYSDLAKQLEQAKIQVKQDTPVFTIIEPVSVPTKKSKPNRPMILIIWLFLGGVIGTGWVFGKDFIEPMKKKWKEEA